MTVISASRRTDIPAFYSEWFMNRIRAGHVRWRSPFCGREYEVSLRSEETSAIVFWSKDFRPLLPHLDELDARGFRCCFHFTITGLPTPLEPWAPNLPALLECARTLSRRYGPEAVLWRYDPVVISNITPAEYHFAHFEEIASALEGVVRRCYLSFPFFYAKVLRNLDRLKREHGIECFDLPMAERPQIANRLADIAAEREIEMFSCCGDYLVNDRIKKAHCVDAELLRRLFPDRIGVLAERPTRKECGCFESKDMGAYDTCPHGCVYCYANAGKEAAARNYRAHDPTGDMIVGATRRRGEKWGNTLPTR